MMKRSAMGRPGDSIATTFVAGRILPPWSRDEWRFCLGLILAVIVVYLPVWRAGYIWDDRIYIEANPSLGGLSGLKDIWTSSAADISPLTSTTFWVEHALWGLKPLPFHLVNVFQHAACAVLLWRVLLALRVPGAWLGAALWALHPLQVESVAWVSELKNPQSGVFFLLAILFFIRSMGGKGGYLVSLLFGGLAMASKSSTVVLPVVLCLVAWWIEGRWQWRNVARAVPFLALAAVASAVSVWTQSLALATLIDPEWVRPMPERLVTAGVAVWFYLAKLLWPYPVMTFYPRWHFDASRVSSYLPLAAVFVALLLLWLKRSSWARPWFFAFAYFLTALLPVLGIFDNYIFQYSLVFDHFQYLASMGPLALIGAGLIRLADYFGAAAVGLRAGLLLILGALSWLRCLTFTSEETLWADTLTKNPGSVAAHYNLGVALAEEGKIDAAMAEYRNALALNPHSTSAGDNLGLLLKEQGKVDEAIAQFRRVLAFNPNSADANNNLGTALAAKGRMDEALAQYQQAVKIDPGFALAHFNIAGIRSKKGQLNDAIFEYRRALALTPASDIIETNLGVALFQTGQGSEGMVHLQHAVELNPNSAQALNNLGNAYLTTGQFGAGMEQYQKALAIDPKFNDARRNLGVALLYGGEIDEAISQLQDALRANPNDATTKAVLAKAQTMAAQKAGQK